MAVRLRQARRHARPSGTPTPPPWQANASGREGPEGQAAGRELARAAEELRGTLGASAPPGWDQPGHLEFARWHLAEMHAHLRAARDELAADLKDAKGPMQ